MGNIALEAMLQEKGFKTIGRVDNSSHSRKTSEEIKQSWKRVKDEALSLALGLNARGEKYLAFSNSYMAGYSGYTFMKKR